MKWCCNQDHSPCFSIEDKGSDAAAIKKYIKMDPAAQIVPLKEFDQIAMHTHEMLPGDNKFLANPSKKEFDAATTTSTSTTHLDCSSCCSYDYSPMRHRLHSNINNHRQLLRYSVTRRRLL